MTFSFVFDIKITYTDDVLCLWLDLLSFYDQIKVLYNKHFIPEPELSLSSFTRHQFHDMMPKFVFYAWKFEMV